MTSAVEVERDAHALAQWIEDHGRDFVPLEIVSAEGTADGNADGNLIIFVTVSLLAPPGGGAWSTNDLLKLYEAADRWAYDAGYPIGPHVHLQTATTTLAG